MRQVTINGITRSYLSQTKRPVHYYYRCLKFSSDCLRELLYDTLKIVNTVRLPINEFFECIIPNDYIDWCGVGSQSGQFVRPLIQKRTLNRLPNLNTDGSQLVYPEVQDETGEFGGSIQWWGLNTNTQGEDTGGYYGIGAGTEPDTFTIVEERNIIQLNQKITGTKIVLQYISDGTFSNAATQITPYAQRTIETYIDWQYKENSKSFGAYDSERAMGIFNSEYRKLRARKNELSPETLERIINRSRKASLK